MNKCSWNSPRLGQCRRSSLCCRTCSQTQTSLLVRAEEDTPHTQRAPRPSRSCQGKQRCAHPRPFSHLKTFVLRKDRGRTVDLSSCGWTGAVASIDPVVPPVIPLALLILVPGKFLWLLLAPVPGPAREVPHLVLGRVDHALLLLCGRHPLGLRHRRRFTRCTRWSDSGDSWLGRLKLSGMDGVPDPDGGSGGQDNPWRSHEKDYIYF